MGKGYKVKQDTKKIIVTVLAFALLIGWCSMPDQDISASEIISVSENENSLSERPAVSVTFGESENNNCSLTVLRENITQGYSVYSLRGNKYQFVSFDCNWDGVWYIQNSNLDTYVDLQIVSVDQANKRAELLISAKLSEHKKINENPSGDTAELNRVKLVITGKHFDNLTKQM